MGSKQRQRRDSDATATREETPDKTNGHGMDASVTAAFAIRLLLAMHIWIDRHLRQRTTRDQNVRSAHDRTRRLAPAALSPSSTSSDIATSCRRRLEPSSCLGTHEISGDGAPQVRIPRPEPNPTGRESCLDPPLRHRSAPASRAQDNALAGCRTEQLLLDTWKTSAWWKRWFMAIRARNSTQDRSRLPQGFTATLEASSAFLGSAKVMVRLESCE